METEAIYVDSEDASMHSGSELGSPSPSPKPALEPLPSPSSPRKPLSSLSTATNNISSAHFETSPLSSPPRIPLSSLLRSKSRSTSPQPRQEITIPVLINAPALASKPTKPKSTKSKPAKSPSPSPPPLPKRIIGTIRLEIDLGGPNNYEVDIDSLAKAAGQRPPTPLAPVFLGKGDSSDSEPEPPAETTATTESPAQDTVKKRKKRKPVGAENYDTSDPFIDDSELAIDQRTFFAQTKQQGFYVSSGEVALLKDNSPKKPRSKRPPVLSLATPGAGPSSVKPTAKPVLEGTRESPIALMSDGEDAPPKTNGTTKKNGTVKKEETEGALDPGADQVGQKRKRNVPGTENGKRRKTTVEGHSFHPELQKAIDGLKVAIAQESWETKGKFPPGLKPILAEVALKAIKLDEYDEYFWSLMPTLFPYNKFTMTKLIKRTVYQDHVNLLNERSDNLLKELEDQAKNGFPKAEEEWEKGVKAWEKRQEKRVAEAEANGDASGNASMAGDDSGAPTRHGTEEMEVDEKDGPKEPAPKADPNSHPPPKKYRMTDSMKNIVWELVLLSNEGCRLENEKNTLEGSVLQVSEQGLRKVLYQKIVAAFPDGWMSSGQISRDVSAMKKRYEKEAMENE
ncbi:hypothetical protein C8J56DRAFT_1016307 [Mycena floridula]|nr:hypothetical protein C8J56DRAFT_1016307 [Mycena floridula]